MSLPKGSNPNHPLKGSRISVDPIKQQKDIKNIKKLLANNPRNYALFVIGINTNLRASDLCRNTVGMVRHLEPMDELEINEKKTGKPRRITLNKTCVDAIQKLLTAKPLKDDDQLFLGQRGRIVPQTINALSWCRQLTSRVIMAAILCGKPGATTRE